MADNMKQERISRGAQCQARYRDIVMMSPSQTRERRYARRLLESFRLSATHVDLYFFSVSVRQLAKLQISAIKVINSLIGLTFLNGGVYLTHGQKQN